MKRSLEFSSKFHVDISSNFGFHFQDHFPHVYSANRGTNFTLVKRIYRFFFVHFWTTIFGAISSINCSPIWSRFPCNFGGIFGGRFPHVFTVKWPSNLPSWKESIDSFLCTFGTRFWCQFGPNFQGNLQLDLGSICPMFAVQMALVKRIYRFFFVHKLQPNLAPISLQFGHQNGGNCRPIAGQLQPNWPSFRWQLQPNLQCNCPQFGPKAALFLSLFISFFV